MQSDALEIIKKTEQQLSLKIKEKKDALENLEKERILFWREKEAKLESERKKAEENLLAELKEDFAVITEKVNAEYDVERAKTEAVFKKNLTKFEKEAMSKL